MCDTWIDLFKMGARCGLMPNELLDLRLDELLAVFEGYNDRLMDQHCLSVYAGYWAGYYQSKRPKPPHVIIRKLTRKKSTHIDDVDVEGFLAMEERFKAQMELEKER